MGGCRPYFEADLTDFSFTPVMEVSHRTSMSSVTMQKPSSGSIPFAWRGAVALAGRKLTGFEG
jgi:hypothetical protein